MDTYNYPDEFPNRMGAKRTATPEGRLTNLSRLLQRSHEDPSLLLAREFAGEARQNLAEGKSAAAEGSMAAARLALRLGNHSLSGLSAAEVESERGAGPSPLDPPAPPLPRYR